MSNSKTITQPLNSPIELGVRALILLIECFPQKLSLQQLVALDYILVHSDDFSGGPKSIHPKLPRRSGEFLIKRKIIRNGCILFIKKGLINQVFTSDGIKYEASESSVNFLDSLTTEYISELRDRSHWVISYLGDQSENSLNKEILSKMDEWGSEFTMESVLWEGF